MIVYSTIGGFFFLLSVFVGLVQFLKDLISGNVVIKNNEVIFELDSMYQFLILGNVEDDISPITSQEALYQFLISGNVEQQIVFIYIIRSSSGVVKCNFY